ncbi:MAG: RNA polymerase sigma factor [Bacteroidales bacterium]|nr:RNA polymerase sigma factor [Bacteroidales bacterium]
MDSKEINELTVQIQNPATRNAAFSKLVKLLSKPLYWHIRKMVLVHEDADDVLQNTFMKAWKALDSFRGDSQINTWIYRIATNEALTFLAQQRMKNVTSSLEIEEVMVSRLEADSYFSGDEAAKKLQEAIVQLPEKQRLVFNMKYFSDMKYEEMSEILGTSVGALKASYHHAVKKIEAYLTNTD